MVLSSMSPSNSKQQHRYISLQTVFPFGCAAPLLPRTFPSLVRRKLSTERFQLREQLVYVQQALWASRNYKPANNHGLWPGRERLGWNWLREITPTRDGGALGGGVGSGSSSANMISTSSERRNAGATYSSIDLEHEVANEDPRTLRKAIMNERAAPTYIRAVGRRRLDRSDSESAENHRWCHGLSTKKQEGRNSRWQVCG